MWVRAMRIFQLEIKTFHGWPLIEPIFYSDPAPPPPLPPKKINFQWIQCSIALPTPLYSKTFCNRKFYSTFTRHQSMAKKLSNIRDRRGSASLQQKNRAATIVQLLISEKIWCRVSVLDKYFCHNAHRSSLHTEGFKMRKSRLNIRWVVHNLLIYDKFAFHFCTFFPFGFE